VLGPIVVVEPLYGAVAAALALDAGWGSVEIAGGAEGDAGTAPIPLVSFEQPPAPEHRGGRCRVRSGDALHALTQHVFGDHPTLLGAPAFARPLSARLAALANDGAWKRLTFVTAESVGAWSDESGTAFERICADAAWASGMLIRILLEELDVCDATLTDAAGITVSLAQGAENTAAQLGAGARWRRHLARGGAADDLRIASAVDSIGVTPVVRREDDCVVAEAWTADQ